MKETYELTPITLRDAPANMGTSRSTYIPAVHIVVTIVLRPRSYTVSANSSIRTSSRVPGSSTL